MLNAGNAPERSLVIHTAIVLLLSVAYAALCLSPSSYALALHALGVQQDGLILGTPKALRSDEWAVWTPYVQIAVNNGFERMNATSPYGEDLRNFNALPLKDWALAFKPQFWAFFLLDPAYAFSISHAVVYAAFLIGWPLALRAMGFPVQLAIGGGLLLFVSSYTQLWWTTTGPLLAGFPWLLITILSRLRPWLKLPLLAWATTAWLISHLYPPIIVTLGFLGAAAILAFRRDALAIGNVAITAAAALFAGVLTWLYLAEPMTAMSHTVYPGARDLPGGLFPPLLILAQIFPFLAINGEHSLIDHNYLEVATGGSYLVLLTLAFLDHGAFLRAAGEKTAAGRTLRTSLAVLLGAFALILLWLLLPLPAWTGAPLLWNLVHPHRFVFVLGALLLLLALTALSHAPLRFGARRLGAAAGLIVVAWAVSKWNLAPNGTQADYSELWIVPALGVAVALRAWIRLPAAAALIGVAFFVNAWAFMPYNPLQSAWPIFHRPEISRVAALQVQQEEHPRGWLVASGYPGATLNGWGLRSIAHVLIAPKLDFFRTVFPDMDDRRFEAIFNRYAHLTLAAIATPVVPASDLIQLPFVAFGPMISQPTVSLSAAAQSTAPAGGHIDGIQRKGDELAVTGWMMAESRDHGRRLLAQVEGAEAVLSLSTEPRPDVAEALGNARLGRAGFVLKLRLASGAADPATLCLWSDSNAFGRRLLTGGRNCP